MKKTLVLLLLLPLVAFCQQQLITGKETAHYNDYFREAYLQYPSIPRGILEAVAYSNTRVNHLVHLPGQEESCIGLPLAYGVMGLTLDGKGYFNNNLIYVSDLSGIPVDEIIANPEKNILAYAGAFNTIKSSFENQNAGETKKEEIIFNTLIALSELPHEDEGQLFALHSQLYSYFWFLSQPEFQETYNFPEPDFDLQTLFGEENYRVLSSDHVLISDEEITDGYGNTYKSGGNSAPSVQSTDYTPAIWNAAASCNYSSRSQAISAVTIHDVEGSYASCISWFQNCNAQVSAHYVVRSSDGQITQMVLESKKAWHVGSENGYTIGIEHEGYATQTGWYTSAMFQSSSNLVKDICNSGYGINPATAYNGASCNCHSTLSSAVKIKGHQHYTGTSKIDPGVNWNWGTYYNLINSITNTCGTPVGLTVTSITSNSAVLNWNAVPGAISYTVVYTSSSGSATTTSSGNSVTLTGLDASTTYQYKVQAVCNQSVTGSFSSIASFTTTATTSSNSTLTIGTATTPYSAHPYGTVYMDERVQYIISKAELTAAGFTSASPYLKSISFYVSSASPQTMENFKITIAHTPGTSFTSTSFLNGTNSTVAYTGTVSTTQGWNTYTLTTPFQYNGTSSLLITICWDNDDFTVNSAVYAKSHSTYVALYYRADLSNSGPCAKATGTRSYYRPNAKLEFSSSPSLFMQQGSSTPNSLIPHHADVRTFEIFPNPSDGTVLNGILSNITNGLITLKMYDLPGRELFSKDAVIAGGSFSVALTDMPVKPGIYTVVGITDTDRFTRKLVVK